MAKLFPEPKTDALFYLQSHSKSAENIISLADERRLFEQKFSLCHILDRIFIEPLTNATRQHIVQRMQSKAPGLLNKEDARLAI